MISNVKERIKELKLDNPRLDVLRTSDRSDSDSYIKRKRKILEGAGIEFKEHNVCGNDRQSLIKLIGEMNSNPAIHGILVQFPLGSGLKKYFRNKLEVSGLPLIFRVN